MTAAIEELPGRTTVSERAVRRIAARAAREVAGIEREVEANAEIRGDRTSLDIRVRIGYPHPVASVTDACRAHLVRRTTELTGLVVATVDISVAELTAEKVVGGRIR
ncbi:hypothetical protein [Nocardia arizonensis]|uniref:hypothetical protein n=1 Tax=Nocardia arizonensis TaxID=1141647 RepID=UPI0006D08CA8|nr:hypothetical protein [Nocardia arizonensis]